MENSNANNPEVVSPESADTQTEITQPSLDIDAMSDSEFDEYLKKAYNGEQDAVTASSVGADAGDTVEEETEPSGTEENKQPFKVFSSEEEYKTDRQRFFDEHIGQRLKNAREDGEIRARLEGFAKDFYKDSDNPLEALMNDLQNQSAQALGMSADNYKQYSEDRRDAEAYREEQRRAQAEQAARDETISRWKNEEQRLKMSVPDFDFSKAMENEAYRELVHSGMSLDAAYYKVQLDEMNAAKPVTTQRRSVPQNAQTKGVKSGSSVNDMMNMSDDNFLKEINKLMGR